MIEQDAKQLIQKAVEQSVSDIHILPLKEQYAIYFRYHGQMTFLMEQTLDWGKRLISYFKFLANLDVGEKRKPQSGAIHYQLIDGQVELRLSTITNVQLVESLVIRVIRQPSKKDSQLQVYFPLELEMLRRLIRRKSGLILFSGPVGSGKTTTIYQLLRERMSEEILQIITMEDPVEIVEEQFLQTEVNVRAGITYEELIKASLRHHPDILLIGEIRDEETAKMVIRGALTGHLMIATIHAKNALGVIGRLQELAITDQQIAQTLIGIISQRLVPCLTQMQSGRAAIMEVLEGKSLKRALVENDISFKDINRQLRKAWAYGYISTQNFHKFEVV